MKIIRLNTLSIEYNFIIKLLSISDLDKKNGSYGEKISNFF
jgi:hypothetical protein